MSNHYADPTPVFSTLVELLQWRALYQPEQLAFRFLQDGEAESDSLNYQVLDRQARIIGAWLQDLGYSNKPVILLYPPGLEFITAFFGCLYANVIAVPGYPPRRNHHLNRLQTILTDTQATLVLTTSAFLTKLAEKLSKIPELTDLKCLATDTITDNLQTRWQPPVITKDTLAFLQYTSGSTGQPKGVMVTHGNLLHNSACIQQSCGLTPSSVSVNWLPTFHDMGLVDGIIQPIYTGFLSVLLPPVTFLQHPIAWLRTISDYKATHSGGPNFAYNLCISKISLEQQETLDLSSWSSAYNGAEPISSETLEKFANKFQSCGFQANYLTPCYGMAEATLMISMKSLEDRLTYCQVETQALEQNRVILAGSDSELSQQIVSCGQPWLDTKVVIADPESMTRCSWGQIGEIWVSGSSITQGYWQQPESTDRTFKAYLADTGEGPFLRTGDLGFLKDGELFVTGRLKDLIVIRGRNLYPQDIEMAVENSHLALKRGGCSAFGVELGGEERLVVLQEVERSYLRKLNINEVIADIRQSIVEHYDLEVYGVVLLKPGSIPKTTSGKIQRHACKTAFVAGDLQAVGQWTRNLEQSQGNKVNEFGETNLLPPNSSAIAQWLKNRIAERIGLPLQEIDGDKSFASYGLDSLGGVNLATELEAWLGSKISPTLLYEYPTINTLAQHLAQANDLLLRSPEVTSNTSHSNTEAIAIVGIGCRFPGAPNPTAFWTLLRNGTEAIAEIPNNRWNIDAFYDPKPGVPGKMNTRWGGFLEEIEEFDAQFFEITPREAVRLDPQQRLLLEIAWEAMEDAGLVPESLAGSDTGVFIGMSASEYGSRQLNATPESIDTYTTTGSALSIAANRLAYFFDFRGPSLVIDTACSSSLVAVDLACQSLWNGQCTLALAGGVNLILSPQITINFSQGGATSPDGRCKAFDELANGMVRGEGAGIVVLKPLSLALADGDPIYATILGSAVNQDGRTNGITAPNPQAQEKVLREAYRKAGISPGQVQYIEAHGTGTLLGDPIEAKAIGSVVASDRSPGQMCLLGSVKTNIGHLEAAAGIAGLIKVALSLKHQEIPPSLHFQNPNPLIPFSELSLRVPKTLESWQENSNLAIAGVSAFGFGGTNAHVVLQKAPKNDLAKDYPSPNHTKTEILPLSAKNPQALRDMAQKYRQFLQTEAGSLTSLLPDVCYTASVRRTHHRYRCFFLANSCQKLSQLLGDFVELEDSSNGFVRPQSWINSPKVVFVFSGYGGQWQGMGQELCAQEPVFNSKITQCHELLSQYTNWSLVAEIGKESDSNIGKDLEITQVAIFAIQVALAELWRSWGIIPDAVVGHSLGEVAAAHIAGVLSLSDAIEIIYHRSHLLSQIVKEVGDRGAMATLKLSKLEAQQAIAGYEDQLSIAAHNSPKLTVLSGDRVALEEVIQSLKQKKIAARIMNTPGAGHSPQVNSIQEDLIGLLAEINPKSETIPIFSTVTGQTRPGDQFDAAYWGLNLREPVLFADAIQALVETGSDDLFIEISPHPIIGNAISQSLHHCNSNGVILPSLRQQEGERAVMLESLGNIYKLGHTIEWNKIYANGGNFLSLPSYPWQKEHFWWEESETNHSRNAKQDLSNTSEYPFLSQYLKSSIESETHFWETEINTQRYPYLNDHQFQGTVLLPAAAYVEMVFEAVEKLGWGSQVLTEVSFEKALFLPQQKNQKVQLVFSKIESGIVKFQISSLQQQSLWTLHSTGIIDIGQIDELISDRELISPQSIQARCSELISATEFYQTLQAQGGDYGTNFQCLQQIWRGYGEAIGELQLPPEIARDSQKYQIHPALLDACFQVLAATLPKSKGYVASDNIYLPVGIGSIKIHRHLDPDLGLWSHAILNSDPKINSQYLTGDVFLRDFDGRIIVEVLGLSCQSLETNTEKAIAQDLTNSLYQIKWEPQALLSATPENHILPIAQPNNWLILSDQGIVGQTLKSRLEEAGDNCVIVQTGENYQILAPGAYQIDPNQLDHFQQLYQDAFESKLVSCTGVIHLWSLNSSPETTLASLELAQEFGCFSVLHLVQVLSQLTGKIIPHLWLITSGVQPVDPSISSLSVSQSPLWGLGRVITHEHQELQVKMVDLSLKEAIGDIESLLAELKSFNAENQVALRGSERYVGRLVPYTLEKHSQAGTDIGEAIANPHPEITLSPEATYLISGGLGGLGLTCAQWMVQQGARHLVLIGRTGAASANQEALKSLQELGVEILITKVDVTQEQQIISLVSEIEQSMPPLKGIIHAAAGLDDGILLQLNRERFELAIAPKIMGAWNLHTHTLQIPLDFFVLFSSAASVLGSPGQGNYTAGNAFLDTLAHYRRTQGLPALSINWGPWSQVGGAARPDRGGRLLRRGVSSILPKQGVEILGQLLQEDITQVLVLPADWLQVGRAYPGLSKLPLLMELVTAKIDECQHIAADRGTVSLTRHRLLSTKLEERQNLLESYIREQLAREMELSPTRLDIHQPLNTLGIDSLMAVELKNQLEVNLQIDVSIAQLLQGSTISQLSAQLLDKLTEKNSQPPNSLSKAVTSQSSKEEAEQLLNQLDRLSDPEIDTLLTAMLIKSKVDEDE